MPTTAIASAIDSLRTSLNIAKTMEQLNDAETFRLKSVHLAEAIADALEKSIAVGVTQTDQFNRINILEAELIKLKEWNSEKQKYELVAIGGGYTAFMMKPNVRGSAPPHWLCPNCFERGQKSYLQPMAATIAMGGRFGCEACGMVIATGFGETPRWRT